MPVKENRQYGHAMFHNSRQYSMRTRAQVRDVYITANSSGEALTVVKVAKMFGIGIATVERWAANEKWRDQAHLARHSGVLTQQAAWLIEPMVDERVTNYFEEGAGEKAIEKVSQAAIKETVEKRVLPHIAELVAGHVELAEEAREIAGMVFAKFREAIESGMEWEPKDLLSAMRMAKDLAAMGIREARIAYNLPTTVSQAVKKDDAPSASDIGLSVSVNNFGEGQRALAEAGIQLPGMDVLDADFEVDPGGDENEVHEPQH